MNVDLASAASRHKQKDKRITINDVNKNLGFGLNNRTDTTKTTASGSSSRPAKKSVFGGDDSSSASEDGGQNSGRQNVNRALASEHEALRRRAEAAMKSASASSSNIYDYDGNYESFSSGYQHDQASSQPPSARQQSTKETKKESRYVASLLKNAKHRQHEREMVVERKIAREQAEEESKEEYLGKEKFVTKAYKRKLAEREAWINEEEKRAKKEAKEDVTKKKGGDSALVAGFYGNLSKNVSMGGQNAVANVTNDFNEANCNKSELNIKDDIPGNRMNDELSEYCDRNNEHRSRQLQAKKTSINIPHRMEPRVKENSDHSDDSIHNDDISDELKVQALRAKRIEKILSARKRYLKRRKVGGSE